MAIGFLSKYEQIEHVTFDDAGDYWADVRRYPRRADVKAAQAILISPEMVLAQGEEGQTDTRGKVDTGGYQDELVARCLLRWNLTDEEGEAIPLGTCHPTTGPDEVRRAAVAILPEEVFEKILGSIAGAVRRRADLKEAEKADAAFPANGRHVTRRGAPTPA